MSLKTRLISFGFSLDTLTCALYRMDGLHWLLLHIFVNLVLLKNWLIITVWLTYKTRLVELTLCSTMSQLIYVDLPLNTKQSIGHSIIVDSVSNFFSQYPSSSVRSKLLAQVVTRSTTNTTLALNSLHWLPIQQRINFKLATLVHRSLHNAGPQYMSSLLHTPSRQIRSASLNLLTQPRIITFASRGFRHAGPSLWNSLPHHLPTVTLS